MRGAAARGLSGAWARSEGAALQQGWLGTREAGAQFRNGKRERWRQAEESSSRHQREGGPANETSECDFLRKGPGGGENRKEESRPPRMRREKF